MLRLRLLRYLISAPTQIDKIEVRSKPILRIKVRFFKLFREKTIKALISTAIQEKAQTECFCHYPFRKYAAVLSVIRFYTLFR